MRREVLRLEVTFLERPDGLFDVSVWDCTGSRSNGELVLSDAQAVRLRNVVAAALGDERRRLRRLRREARSIVGVEA